MADTQVADQYIGDENGCAAHAFNTGAEYAARMHFYGRLARLVGTPAQQKEARDAVEKALSDFAATIAGGPLRDMAADAAIGVAVPTARFGQLLMQLTGDPKYKDVDQTIDQAEKLRQEARARYLKWFDGLWPRLEAFAIEQYTKLSASLKNGTWKLALCKLGVDGAFIVLEAGTVLLLAASGAGAAIAAGAAVISVVAKFNSATRKVALFLRRTDRGGNDVPAGKVDIDKDLTDDEKKVLGSDNQGTTTTDRDAGETTTQGGNGDDKNQNNQTGSDEERIKHPREGQPPRSNEELAPGGKIPKYNNGKGEFNEWWDDLSPDELDQLYKDKTLRRRIEARVREPGGLHEWLVTRKGPELKRLGFTMDEIKAMTTPTKQIDGPNPKTGGRWRHTKDDGTTGEGAKQMHNALQKVIEDATSRTDLLKRLKQFSNDWLDDGIDSFPPVLRDAIVKAGD